MGVLTLHLFPEVGLAVFARGAAQLAGLYAGAVVTPIADGWHLTIADLPIGVTAACSATDFFLMLAALLAWQLARRGLPLGLVVTASLLAAVPLAILVNALRVIAVAQAHRWFIPLLPDSWAAFAHLLTGAAIFLPALILISLALEFHGRSRQPAPT